MAITTAMAASFKQEILSGGHCFNSTVTTTATTTNASTAVTAAASLAGVTVGMAVTGTNIAANTVVAAITGAATATLSIAATGAAATLTFTGDVFKMALVKAPGGTYSQTNVNYTDITAATDETTGAGYTAGGLALTNVSAVLNPASTGQAVTTFTPNPTWTSATFSTIGCMIYNSSTRMGGTSGTNTQGAGRCCGVFDFGGTQTVSAGTFSVILPGASSGSAILRIA